MNALFLKTLKFIILIVERRCMPPQWSWSFLCKNGAERHAQKGA
jgi:hypothetical protein